jgi:hypothetical protein
MSKLLAGQGEDGFLVPAQHGRAFTGISSSGVPQS